MAYRYTLSRLQKQPPIYAEGLRARVLGFVDEEGKIEVRCTVSNHSGKSRALLVNPNVNFTLVTPDGIEHMDGALFPHMDGFSREYVVVSPSPKEQTKFHPDETLGLTYSLKGDKDENFVGGRISATLYLYEIIPDEKEGLIDVQYSLEASGDIRKAVNK